MTLFLGCWVLTLVPSMLSLGQAAAPAPQRAIDWGLAAASVTSLAGLTPVPHKVPAAVAE